MPFVAVRRNANTEIVIADETGFGPTAIAALVQLRQNIAGCLFVEDDAQIAGSVLGVLLRGEERGVQFGRERI